MLNETIKLKESIKDATESLNEMDNTQKNGYNLSYKADEEEVQFVKETIRQKQKCDECDFETCVPKYIKGHKAVKHKEGQYQCQLGFGCKNAFKTLKEVDFHITQVHTTNSAENIPKFNCARCNISFDAKAKLRVHNEKKHTDHQRYPCQLCEKSFPGEAHMNKCTTGFQTVNPQPCRYYINGFCLKGNSCVFSHEIRPSVWAPFCRYGQRCDYLAYGECSFFHPGI